MAMSYLSVTESTVDARAWVPTFKMARNTTLHPQLRVEADERANEGKHSLGNFSVACLAKDLPSHDVSSVGKAHVLVQHVHTFPGERLSGAQHLDQLDFLGAVSESLVVAIQADLPVRNGRVVGLFRTEVAISARDLLLGHVDLVNEGDGLLGVAIG
jgi:hypothetical protein